MKYGFQSLYMRSWIALLFFQFCPVLYSGFQVFRSTLNLRLHCSLLSNWRCCLCYDLCFVSWPHAIEQRLWLKKVASYQISNFFFLNCFWLFVWSSWDCDGTCVLQTSYFVGYFLEGYSVDGFLLFLDGLSSWIL